MSYQDIDVQELDEFLQQSQPIIFDTRDAISFSQGHLTGASMITDQAIQKLMLGGKRNLPVLIYCYHGNSSRDVCQLLSAMGFSDVYNLTGGWQALQLKSSHLLKTA